MEESSGIFPFVFFKKTRTGNHVGKMDSAGVEPSLQNPRAPWRSLRVQVRHKPSFPDSAILFTVTYSISTSRMSYTSAVPTSNSLGGKIH